MKKEPTSLPDVFQLFPEVYPDDRGAFLETYNADTFRSIGIIDEFIQDNLSISKQNVLRGIHFQLEPFSQSKLVSVASGKVFDVAVDLRRQSPNFGKWIGVTLDDATHNMLYIPRGFGHGYYVLSSEAKFMYKVAGGVYNKESSAGIIWSDPSLHITWPLVGTPILSAQDANLPKISEDLKLF
ncbi:MAG TPA: dTDP-4-dehydrorhamnose 3,5-epimerase [Patescibacteria group bacterium]|nr:dTDP-4-dehydrorhamnose 3,5-epimerase [Patescibacteria group bacterium]